MANIGGLDALLVIAVVLAAVLLIVWVFGTMRFSLTTRQLFFLLLVSALLGIFLESYFRNTRELVLSTVALVGVMLIWLTLNLRDKLRRIRGGAPRRISMFIAPLAIVMLLLMASLPQASAFTTDTHPLITEAAAVTLEADGKTIAVDMLRAVDEYGHMLYEALISGLTDCDRLDLARNHYYDPVTGEGLTALNSKALCEDLYDEAVRLWRNGDYQDAVYYLGRALHMVQDACIPFHSHNDILNGHSDYEAWLEDNFHLYKALSGGAYSYDSPGEIVEANALVSYSYYGSVVTSNYSLSNYQAAAKALVPLAVRTSAGLLQLFTESVAGSDPGLFIAGKENSAISLVWSPSTDSNFVSYNVYASEPQHEVAIDEEHLIVSIIDREENGINIDGLATYGEYEFVVVTVTADENYTSNVISSAIGYSAYLIIIGMITAGALAAVLVVGTGGKKRRRKT